MEYRLHNKKLLDDKIFLNENIFVMLSNEKGTYLEIMMKVFSKASLDILMDRVRKLGITLEIIDKSKDDEILFSNFDPNI